MWTSITVILSVLSTWQIFKMFFNYCDLTIQKSIDTFGNITSIIITSKYGLFHELTVFMMTSVLTSVLVVTVIWSIRNMIVNGGGNDNDFDKL